MHVSLAVFILPFLRVLAISMLGLDFVCMCRVFFIYFFMSCMCVSMFQVA